MVVDKFRRGLESLKRKRLLVYTDSPYHDLGNKRLARVGTPENNDDAVTKNYLESALESFITKDDLESVKDDLKDIQYFFDFDNKQVVRLSEPSAGFHAATKVYVDNRDAVTKSLIRIECEKVKNEAIAEGHKKREAITERLFKALDSLQADVINLSSKVEALQSSTSVLEHNRRVDNVYVDGLYRYLGVTKGSINVRQKENN